MRILQSAQVEIRGLVIVPVKVRLRNGIKAVQTYAFMDPGSTVTFCSEGLAEQLGASGPRKSITLDTMGKSYSMKTYLIDGLKVTNLDMKDEVDLPTTYTKGTIPVSQHHIPKTDDISKWDHLPARNRRRHWTLNRQQCTRCLHPVGSENWPFGYPLCCKNQAWLGGLECDKGG